MSLSATSTPRLDLSRLAAASVAVSGAAVTIGLAVPAAPRVAFLMAAVVAMAMVATVVPTRFLVAAVLVYLPFQDLVISRVPGGLALPARYGPELLVYAIALPLILTRAAALAGRGARVIVAVTAVGILWSFSGVWNGVSLVTIAAGLRSEFRFVPLVAVVLLSPRVRADARFYARALVFVASVEGVIALLEAVGGASVRAIFAPSYQLIVNGAVVGQTKTPLTTIFGTFSHRNLLGAFLAFAAIVLVAAGPRGLGASRRTVMLAWLLLAAGTLAAVSREGMIALLLGSAFVLSFQHRLPAVRVLVGCGVAVVLALLLVRPPTVNPQQQGVSSFSRWGDVVSASGWSATPGTNFRLYYLLGTAHAVASDAFVTGFGLGTATDPGLVQRGESPLERYSAGRVAARTGYYTDGNWATLLLETGFAGIALLGLLFAYLVALGLKLAAQRVWAGGALAGLVVATALLGFFAPVLQTRGTNMVLWLFAGLAAAGGSRLGVEGIGGYTRAHSAGRPATLRLRSRSRARRTARRSYGRGALGVLGLQVAYSGFSFATAVLLARLLGPGGYGTYAYAVAWVGFLGVPAVLGFDRLVVRELSTYVANARWGLARGLLRRSNQLVSVASVTLGGSAVVAGLGLLPTSMRPTFALSMILVPVTALTLLRQSSLQSLGRSVLSQLPELFIRPALLVAIIGGISLLHVDGLTSDRAMAINVGVSLLAFLLGAEFLRRGIPRPAKIAKPTYETRAWVVGALPMMVIGGIWIVNGYVGTVMLGTLVGARDAGIFSVASRGADLVTMAMLAVNVPLAPRIARLYSAGDGHELQRMITRAARMTIVWSFPVAIGLICLRDVYLGFFGTGFDAGDTVLSLLVLGQLVNVIAGPVGVLLLMTGQARTAALFVGLGAGMNIVLNAALDPFFGILGAGIGAIASVVFWNAMLVVISVRRLRIQPTVLGTAFSV